MRVPADRQALRMPVADPPGCLGCRGGHVVLRQGPRGLFYGCSRYPECRKTESVRSVEERYDPQDPD
jgi:ssDNA-binding Zn-finger/Zn-ribbon topoisomerase 1